MVFVSSEKYLTARLTSIRTSASSAKKSITYYRTGVFPINLYPIALTIQKPNQIIASSVSSPIY